jgi:hypothetical protein
MVAAAINPTHSRLPRAGCFIAVRLSLLAAEPAPIRHAGPDSSAEPVGVVLRRRSTTRKSTASIDGPIRAAMSRMCRQIPWASVVIRARRKQSVVRALCR